MTTEEEEFVKSNDKYFKRVSRNNSRVYCKYCEEKSTVSAGDGIWECDNCGAGLARIYYKDEFRKINSENANAERLI